MILNERGIIKEFDLVVYPVMLVFALGSMEKDINRFYKPYDENFNYIVPSNNPASVYNVRVKRTGDIACLIWIADTDNVRGSYIAHEAAHVAQEIFKYIGAETDFNNQEPFCYLIGTIFRLCNNAFYKWKDYKEKLETKKK